MASASTTTGPILEAAKAALAVEHDQLIAKARARLEAFGLVAKNLTVEHTDADDGVVVLADGVTALSVQGQEIRLVENTMSGWGKPSVPLESLAHLARVAVPKEADA